MQVPAHSITATTRTRPRGGFCRFWRQRNTGGVQVGAVASLGLLKVGLTNRPPDCHSEDSMTPDEFNTYKRGYKQTTVILLGVLAAVVVVLLGIYAFQ